MGERLINMVVQTSWLDRRLERLAGSDGPLPRGLEAIADFGRWMAFGCIGVPLLMCVL